MRSHPRHPESPYASVQDAAYGFRHTSLFAVDCRELCERRSDTLKRRLIAA